MTRRIKERREPADSVTGYYRLLDSDGFLRAVKYGADAVNGFAAEVVREPVRSGPVAARRAVARTTFRTPYANPAARRHCFGSAAYPYRGYQPTYSHGYQPYPLLTVLVWPTSAVITLQVNNTRCEVHPVTHRFATFVESRLRPVQLFLS